VLAHPEMQTPSRGGPMAMISPTWVSRLPARRRITVALNTAIMAIAPPPNLREVIEIVSTRWTIDPWSIV
jgi:hypothetical protein